MVIVVRRFSQALWLFLALAVRLLLETEYKVTANTVTTIHLTVTVQVYIMESGVLPFLLLLPVLMVTGHLHLPSLRYVSV